MKTIYSVLLTTILAGFMLSNAFAISGIAQSRFPAEAGRGFPYASGETWSPFLGMAVVLVVLGIVIAVAAAVKDVLGDERWWHLHLIVLAVATFFGSLGTDISFGHGEYPVEPGIAFYMLIPSFVVVGIVYLVIMKSVQNRRDKKRWGN